MTTQIPMLLSEIKSQLKLITIQMSPCYLSPIIRPKLKSQTEY